jgi:hypothetical protein
MIDELLPAAVIGGLACPILGGILAGRRGLAAGVILGAILAPIGLFLVMLWMWRDIR